jgi:serine/threonine protein kinase
VLTAHHLHHACAGVKQVYLAYCPSMDTDVAIKIVNLDEKSINLVSAHLSRGCTSLTVIGNTVIICSLSSRRTCSVAAPLLVLRRVLVCSHMCPNVITEMPMPLNYSCSNIIVVNRSVLCAQPSIIAEVQTMKLLKHPNILPLYAAFLDDDQLWMVMPYVSGGSASDIMRRTNPNVSCRRACWTLHDGSWIDHRTPTFDIVEGPVVC